MDWNGTIRVYSPHLIAKLEAAGCRPLRHHENGDATFHRTETVRELIARYTRSAERLKRKRSRLMRAIRTPEVQQFVQENTAMTPKAVHP